MPKEMAGAVAQPITAATPEAPAPTDIPAEEPTASVVATVIEKRIGQEPPEPAGDEFTNNSGGNSDRNRDRDCRANFDNAFSNEPKSAAAPLRDGKPSNLPALRRESSRWPALLAWIALIVVVVGVVGGALVFQQSVLKNWAPAQKLYDLIGMSVEPIKKQFGVRSVRYTKTDQNTFRIDGELVNLSKTPHDVPNLRILFRDATDNVVKRWTFPPPARRMLPSEVIKFSTEINHPPIDAERIDVGIDEN